MEEVNHKQDNSQTKQKNKAVKSGYPIALKKRRKTFWVLGLLMAMLILAAGYFLGALADNVQDAKFKPVFQVKESGATKPDSSKPATNTTQESSAAKLSKANTATENNSLTTKNSR